ncbi:MAG: GNAT family N-acetyltransferase [Caldilineaceae bacterium]
MITLRPLTKAELVCAPAIDLSETDEFFYHCVNGQLEMVQQPWRRGDWDAATWQDNLADWDGYLGLDVILGAFATEQLAGKQLTKESLVGLASLCYRKTATVAQVVSIHVSRPYRRQGIGTLLMQAMIRLARVDGATQLYVWATNTPSAIGFYLNHGFHPIAPGHEFYLAEAIDDIPLIMNLAERQ